MLHSVLHRTDDPRLREMWSYSRIVEHYLTRADKHSALAPVKADEYSKVYDFASLCQPLPMSLYQRMQMHYLLGISRAGQGAYDEGVRYLHFALDIAEELDERPSVVELARSLGSVAATIFANSEAITYLEQSLNALRSIADGPVSIDPACELDILVALAAADFALNEHDEARSHLENARLLIPHISNARQHVGTIYWMESLLDRWRGEPERALRLAMNAAEIYVNTAETPDQLAALGRLNGIVADTALDLAETYPANGPGGSWSAFHSLARPYIKRAIGLASETTDGAGIQIARLIRARHDRTAGKNVNTQRAIERVLLAGEKRHDIALIAQAHTALGREFAMRGETEPSLASFRKTLEVLKGTQAPTMGVWARRALLRHSEMYIDEPPLPL